MAMQRDEVPTGRSIRSRTRVQPIMGEAYTDSKLAVSIG